MAKAFRARLKKMNIKAYYHYTIPGYPSNVALIDSDEIGELTSFIG